MREPEVGCQQRVRLLARQERRRARESRSRARRAARREIARRSSIARSRASACATDGGPASTAAAVRVPRSARRTRRRTDIRRGREREPQRRACDPLRRFELVRIAAQRAGELRVVEDERDAEERNAAPRACARRASQGASPRSRRFRAATPPSRAVASPRRSRRGASPGRRAGRSPPRSPRRRGPSPRARGRHAPEERRAGTPASSGSAASCTATLPWKRRRNSGVTRAAISRVARAAREAAGDEQGLLLGRDAELRERLAHRCERQRQLRRRARCQPARRAARARSLPVKPAPPTLRATDRREGSAAPLGSPPRRPSRGPGRGGRNTRASAGAEATTTRLPEMRGTRGTAGFKQRSEYTRTDVPEDAHGRRARPERRARPRRRALPRRRQQPRLPRLLRAAGGARDERGLPDRRAARLREHALQAPLRLPAEGRRGRLGHAPGAPRGAGRGGRGRLQGGAPADAGSPARAVPALPADRRRVRLPEPRVRGLGGGRRDRDARDARRRGRHQDVRRLDRPRRVPARLGERLPDDDAARRERRQRLHARARRGAVRDPPRRRSPTSSASRATRPTTSRASPGSGTRPPGSSSRSTDRSRTCSSTSRSCRRRGRRT